MIWKYTVIVFHRLVITSSSSKPRKDNKSIELVPLSSADELELESVEPEGQRQTANPSLLMAMCHTYIRTFLIAGSLKLITDLLNFVGPVILKWEYTPQHTCDNIQFLQVDNWVYEESWWPHMERLLLCLSVIDSGHHAVTGIATLLPSLLCVWHAFEDSHHWYSLQQGNCLHVTITMNTCKPA